MKTNLLIISIIAIFLTACTPGLPREEIEVTPYDPTKVSFTETTVPQELIVTQQPLATATPTKTPTTTPPGCVTLLTPPNGAEIPAIGKITFSWNPAESATFYVLNIILPSGTIVAFDAKQAFREQYMEAFSAGGQYQWKVIVQDRKRNEICSSELATFSKPAYDPPRQPRNDDGKKK